LASWVISVVFCSSINDSKSMVLSIALIPS
jgi:hypothetical protein